MSAFKPGDKIIKVYEMLNTHMDIRLLQTALECFSQASQPPEQSTGLPSLAHVDWTQDRKYYVHDPCSLWDICFALCSSVVAQCDNKLKAKVFLRDCNTLKLAVVLYSSQSNRDVFTMKEMVDITDRLMKIAV